MRFKIRRKRHDPDRQTSESSGESAESCTNGPGALLLETWDPRATDDIGQKKYQKGREAVLRESREGGGGALPEHSTV